MGNTLGMSPLPKDLCPSPGGGGASTPLFGRETVGNDSYPVRF